MAVAYVDTFEVDGPLGPPDYLDASDVLGYDPGLTPPTVSGGLLFGVDPESAPMLVVPAEGVDTLAAIIGPVTPSQLVLMLASSDDPATMHFLSIAAESNGFNWMLGPDFSGLMVGNFAAPLVEGDRVEMRVVDGTAALLLNGVEVESAADPLGLASMTAGLAMSGDTGSIASIEATGPGVVAVTGLLGVAEAIAAALRPLADVIPGLQVTPFLNWNPTPPSLDVYPADLFQAGLGFGADQDTFWVVRARTTTADHEAGQRALLRLLDRSNGASVENALTADQTLGGVVQSTSIADEGVSGYRVYLEDPQGNGSLIGCEWRVEVITK